jgi:hypothetical protein
MCATDSENNASIEKKGIVFNSDEVATEYGFDEPVGDFDYFPWYAGGGRKPNSGQELGVQDASLEDRASCFSLWSLGYLNPLLSLGSRKVLDSEDVGVPSEQDSANMAYQKTKNAWDEQVRLAEEKNKKILADHQAALDKCGKEEDKASIKPPVLKEPSVAKALMKSFGASRFWRSLIYYVISSLLSFVPVMILNDLVSYFEHVAVFGTGEPFDHYVNPWIEVIGLGVIPLLVSLLQTRHQAIMAHCGVFVRTAASTLLYRKSLNVSAAGRAKTSTGQVVNMMSNDTMQLQRFLQFMGMTLGAPIQIIIALYLIYGQVSVLSISNILLSNHVISHSNCFRLHSHSGGQCNLGRCGLHGPFGSR